MVEIARAFTVSDAPARLVILDEPTSSLDAHTAGQLLAYVRRSVASGVSCVLISHILGEVLSTCDRIVVMRDGKVVVDRRRAELRPRPGWSARWAASSPSAARLRPRPRVAARGETPVVVRVRPERQTDDQELVAHEGEIIGLAGLAGHGQTDLLLAIFAAAARRRAGVDGRPRRWRWSPATGSPTASFPRWSIAQNIGVRSLDKLRVGPADLAAPRGRARRRAGASASRSARPTSTTTSCRSRAAISRRRCSPARSARTRASC